MSSFRSHHAAVRRGAILSVMLVLLGSCGFQPLYESNPARSQGTAEDMATIEIAPIADRVGQILRNALRDRLTPLGKPTQPRYRLDVSLVENRSNLIIQQDATSTFAKFRLRARYALIDLVSGAPITRGVSENTTIFNIVESEFANLNAERDAKRRAAIEVSDDIRLRLALYFGSAPQR